MHPINRQKTILTLLLSALLFLPALNLPQTKADQSQDSWSALASMPTPRGSFGLAVVNGKIYAIGGLNGNNLPVSTNEEYDPMTDTWTSKMPMPTPRNGFAIVVYQNKIYVIGGTVGNGFVGNNEVYNPATNTWETETSMPTPRADLSASVVGDKIYLIGGKKYVSIAPFFNETNLNEVYDPTNDAWSAKTPIPTPVQGYSSAVFNDKIYIMGGSLGATPLENSQITGATQVYSPENDNWTLSANLANVDSYGAAATTEGYMAPVRIFVAGGFSDGQFTSRVQAYYPENNTWKIVNSMSTARAYLGMVESNDVLYAIGGFDGKNWLGINERYTPVGFGTIPPIVQVISPENRTYTEVTLRYTTNRGTQWMGYSLDDNQNVTVTEPTVLGNLTQGVHSVTVYANDSLGNMGASTTVYFAIDLLPPEIEILLPQDRSYDTTDIQVTFTVNEAVANLSYSLDGQPNQTIIGNLTLPALTNGRHKLTIQATDEVGNTAEKTVNFTIAPFPFVNVVAAAASITIAIAAGYLLFKRKPNNDKK